MENFKNQLPEQTQLYQLILKANREQTQEIKSEFQAITSSLSQKLEETCEEIEVLKEKYIELERKIKKNNIIIFGVQVENQDDLLENILKILNSNLGCNIITQDVNNIYKLGNSRDAPILIEFISYLKKSTLFKCTEKLKELRKIGITISNDMSKDDRETLKILKKHQKIARSENIDAKIKGFKLIVNGISHSAKQLEHNLRNKEDNSNEEGSEEDISSDVEEIPGSIKKFTSESLVASNYDSDRKEANEKKKRKGKPSPVSTRNTAKKKK